MMKRAFQPTGLCLAILGSDGAGKSTLLERLQTQLRPTFPEQQTLHFRPGIFEKKKTGVVTDPHGRAPRNVFLSWLKVGYYFVDFWAGWWLVILPARRLGRLIIFDRSFDDLLVDQRRYRLQGTATLVRVLRHLLPGADRTFILTAPAKVLQERKPELPLVELERQQEVFRQLANTGKSYVLVSAEQPPEQVAQKVLREVMTMVARENPQHHKKG